ncbi:hypothetical protein PVK06_026654 [Gossypium arboreum]|uniref:Uncharacterized protein n=1 Tax=Gossypium arboreum TaxID=29729 RepID=A0ABR0NY86_GOSAR|nr:hypothetical protein PVK06_026654 [Gossypium arboreum]
MTEEPATKAPVNGGRNYNSSKIVKFLVGKRLGEIDMSVKMQTTRTLTKRHYEASLFPRIGFGLFLCSLGGRRKRPSSGGPEPLVRYHSRRARILTLCQGLRAKEQSQVDNFY